MRKAASASSARRALNNRLGFIEHKLASATCPEGARGYLAGERAALVYVLEQLGLLDEEHAARAIGKIERRGLAI